MVHGNDPEQSFQNLVGSRLLTNISKLQLLRGEGYFVQSVLSVAHLPQLIWLSWKNCPYTSLPSWIPLKNLRVLYIEGRNLETLWQHESQVIMLFLILDRNTTIVFSSNRRNCLLLNIVFIYHNAGTCALKRIDY
jgi:hypothetical protein